MTSAKTRIADIRTRLFHHWCFVEITAEDGAKGTGQSGYWAYPDTAVPVVDALSKILVGQNPDDISRLWLEMYRSVPFRGGAVTSAIAAIDIALWDLKGRRFGVPAYQLAGGAHRDRVRLHVLLGMRAWPETATKDDLVEEALYWKGRGFTAVKLDPLLEGPDGFNKQSYSAMIKNAVEVTAAVREAVSDDVDIALEIHRKTGPAEGLALAEELKPYRIYMYEDALPPDSLHEWRNHAAYSPLPVGAGERQDTIYEFDELLNPVGVEFVRPDVGTAGGLSHCIKIAALAEAKHRRLIAHNFHSPFLTAATLQLYAAIPNVGTFEWSPLDEDEPRSWLLKEPLKRDGGFLLIPDSSGIGAELADDVEEKFEPFERLGADLRLPAIDGSLNTR